MGGGYQGAPKGGALAGAGLPLGIKSPSDGDLLAYDLASGTWVNAKRPFWTGTAPQSDLGTGNDPLSDLVLTTVAASGITLSNDGKTLTFPLAGRYLLSVAYLFQWSSSAPADWTEVDLIPSVHGDFNWNLNLSMPPTTLGPVSLAQSMPRALTAGIALKWRLANNDLTHDLLFQGGAMDIQYLGPAT